MNGFDRRWRLLVRAASRAGEAPIPDVPDGALLQRRAAAAGESAAPPWRQAWTSGLAVALLWTAAMPAALPAWRSVRDVLTRLAESAAAPACCSVSSVPAVPSTPSAPTLALPRLPPRPDFLLRRGWPDPPTEAPPKETPS